MAALAELRCSASRRKCKLVLSFKIVAHAAMPMAPPKLRIMLNSPLAYLSRFGGRLPKPRFTAGGTPPTLGENPQNFWGKRSAAPPPLGRKMQLHHTRLKNAKSDN